MRDQILGCILGGAIGDALGGPHEGKRPPIEMSDDDEWRLSDDTQLTLATLEAITSCGGSVDPAVIADHFARWHRASRVTGIGASTFKALSELVFGCSGYVVESIPLALCGASRIESLDFKNVLIELIACGGDTDTTASIAGQVMGALIGRGRLPEEMIARTPERGSVEAIAGAFAESLDYYE